MLEKLKKILLSFFRDVKIEIKPRPLSGEHTQLTKEEDEKFYKETIENKE